LKGVGSVVLDAFEDDQDGADDGGWAAYGLTASAADIEREII